MVICKGFPPVINSKSSVLILGSMPGKESLLREQYYAHPRNYFWFIMDRLFSVGRDLPYSERLKKLNEKDVALWDVIKSCERTSSLDSDIVKESIVVNDFNSLFSKYPNIKKVFFNGQKSHALFVKHVLPNLPENHSITFHPLPSTSPAYASIRLSDKLKFWSVVKNSV